jgi:hypothetical protein
VNTVPPQWGAAAAGALVSGSHVADVLPELLAQPARQSEPSTSTPEKFVTPDKFDRSAGLGKQNIRGRDHDVVRRGTDRLDEVIGVAATRVISAIG